jgi:hypothetical protein
VKLITKKKDKYGFGISENAWKVVDDLLRGHVSNWVAQTDHFLSFIPPVRPLEVVSGTRYHGATGNH